MGTIIKTVGIVLSAVNFSDSDKILTVLTPNLGKISIMAKGVRKRRKENLGCTDLGVISNFVLFKGTKMYHLNESSIIESFYNIRLDYDKLVICTDILKEANKYTEGIENISEIYNIFKLTTYAIYGLLENNYRYKNGVAVNEYDETKEKLKEEKDEIIYITFMIKLLNIIGFKLNLETLDIKEKELDNVSANHDISSNVNGLIYIKSENIYVSINIYKILRYIVNSDVEKVFKYKTNKENIEKLKKFKEIYLENHIF